MNELEGKTTDVQSAALSKFSTGKLNRRTVGLSTVLLGVAAVAAGLGNLQVDSKINHLERQMPGLRNAARELVVGDPSMLAMVERDSQWFDEYVYDIHLPDGESWQLCMALDEVDETGLAEPLARVPLSPGRHVIEVRYEKGKEKEQSIASVLVDRVQVIKEVRDWEARSGSLGGSPFSRITQRDTAKPLVLFRQRFGLPRTRGPVSIPKTPSAGVLVWIEKLEGE